jgi:hypothetical protein
MDGWMDECLDAWMDGWMFLSKTASGIRPRQIRHHQAVLRQCQARTTHRPAGRPPGKES